jgi:D-alanine transaminase
MPRIAYVNGRYEHQQEASVNIEDRGYQFSDGIYEYIAFYNRTLLDGDLHLARMERSLKALGLPAPMSSKALQLVMAELIERNGRENGGMYMQISRGVSARNHAYPKTKPALVMTICAAKTPKSGEFKDGVKVITYPDRRWERRDIKSISLLANIIAKQEAASKQAREAWLYEKDNYVTEGSVSNAYIVSRSGELITHPADEHILGGITRDVLLRLARKAGIRVIERPFTLSEVKQAAEAFITSTSINVLPVVKVDDTPIGNGPGEVTRNLQELYNDHIFRQTGFRFA